MNITIYTLTYNEAYMLPHFIAHYRRNFPDCRIVVYDNESTDNTRQIAETAGCEVRINATGGKLDDMRYLEIKNNCWKELQENSSPYFQGEVGRGWAIVCDCDEFLDITAQELAELEMDGQHAVRGVGYNMVNVRSLPFNSITHAVRAPSYDKLVCFDTRYIAEINYNPGCHSETIKPVAGVNLSVVEGVYRLRHYKYMGADYMITRFAANAARMSDNNLQKGYGGHYLATEREIRTEFETACKQAKQIIF